MKNDNNVNPCYGCDERHTGCDSVCFRYLFWKQEHELTRKAARADQYKTRDADAILVERNRKKRKTIQRVLERGGRK